MDSLFCLAYVHSFCFTYLTSENSGIVSRWTLSQTLRVNDNSLSNDLEGTGTIQWCWSCLALLLASSHGGVSPAAPLSSLPVTHGKAQPGTPGAAFLSVLKSDGVPIDIFLLYF